MSAIINRQSSIVNRQPGNLVETLLEIHQNRRSGVVRLERTGAKKQLVINYGNLTFAESNQADEHLARILLKMNRISRNDLARVTELMKTGKTTAEALLATRKLEPKEIEEGAREQAIIILGSLLGWYECEIRLYPGERLVHRQIDLQIPLPEILMMAARRAAAERKSRSALGKRDEVVLQTKTATAARLLLPLDNVEGFAYAQAEGPIRVDNLLALLPDGHAKPDELVNRLLLLGLLKTEVVAEKSNTESTPSQSDNLALLSLRVEEMLQRFEVANHYEVLSLPTDAGEAEIKAAYHEMARQYHPDLFQSREHTPAFRDRIEKLFTRINGAYTTLSDAVARATYDEARLTKNSQVEAALQARAAVDLDKEKMAEALFRAGRASCAKGDYEQAVSHLKECVWLRPDVSRFRYHLGLAQSEIPRHRKEAEQHFLKAIEMDGTGVNNYIALGKLYLKVNLPRRAEAQFEAVLRWDPDHREAHQFLELLSKERTGEAGLLWKIKRPFSG